MSQSKKGSLLTLAELSEDNLLRLLNVAGIVKREKRKGIFRPLLSNRSLAMIFQKPSTRTRVSMEVAMSELAGHAVNLSMNELQLSRGETIEDTARTLSNYVDGIAARVYAHSDIQRLADAAIVPVINMLSDLYHPCQILADLQTIWEVKNKLKGLKLAWVGDGNNVCNSMLIGCSKVGMNVAVAAPPGYEPLRDAMAVAKLEAVKRGSSVEIVRDPMEAVKGADVVATDVFVSMGSEQTREERMKRFLPDYQVSEKLLGAARDDCIFMHCLPAHRGEEVTSDVIDGPHSVVWQEAENRLHSQKALLLMLLLDETKLPW